MSTFTNTVRSTNFQTSIGGTPSSTDTVRLIEGKDQYTGGLSLPTVDLTLLHATPGFGGDIATTALDIQAAKIILEWSGQVILLTSNAGAGTIDELQVSPTQGGQVSVSSATVTLFIGNAGTALFADSATVTTAEITGGSHYFDKGGTAITTLTTNGGDTYLNRDVATANVNAGRVHVDDSSCSPGTVNLNGSGVVKIMRGGTITTLNGKGGTLDLSELAQDLTITTGNVGPGLTIIRPRSGATLTFGTQNNTGSGPRYA